MLHAMDMDSLVPSLHTEDLFRLVTAYCISKGKHRIYKNTFERRTAYRGVKTNEHT